MILFGFRYPAVIVLVCTIAGTLVGRYGDPGQTALAVGTLATGMALVLALFRLPGRYFVIPLAIFVVAMAAANAGLKYHIHSERDIVRFVEIDRPVRFFASVDKWPALKRHKTILTCDVDSVEFNNDMYPCSGLIHLIVRQETTHFAYGERISFEGKLRRPFTRPFPNDFDYKQYLQNRGIRGVVDLDDPAQVYVHESGHNVIWRHIRAVRLWILDCFRKNLTEIPSALASGFLIGQTKDIPDHIYRAFRRTGTMHLLAVSGSNVALVLAAAYFGLRFVRIRRWLRALILIGIIVVFSHLSYNQPSVVRASIMAALVIGARLFYRRMELNNIIAAAATILIISDPATLFDIGFQLSFAVTWGLILFLPHINEALKRIGSPRFLDYIMLIVFSSVIATLISAPITAHYFGEASLVTVASNLVVVPMVSVAVVGSIILLATQLALPGLAIVVGALLDRLLRWIYAVVLWFGKWEFAEAQSLSFSVGYVFIFLASVAALFFAIRFRLARVTLIVLILAGGSAAIIDNAVIPAEDIPQIEIFNTGAVQIVIINSGGGIVIYRQPYATRHEIFSEDLIPYLKNRTCPVPGTFVFIEPRYRTEHHLAAAAEVYARPVFRPVSNGDSIDRISVWTSREGEFLRQEIDSSFAYTRGILTVQSPNSTCCAFMTRIPDDPEGLADGVDPVDYLIVPLDDISLLAPALRVLDDRNGIFLVNESREEVAHVIEQARKEASSLFVCRSERLELFAGKPHP